MSRSIVETQNKILHDYGERAGSSNGLPFRPENVLPLSASRGGSYDLIHEVQRYLQNEQYDEAFNRFGACNIHSLMRLTGNVKIYRVLSTANLDVVVWLCSQLDPVRLFSTKPFPLRQYILLSLIQQVLLFARFLQNKEIYKEPNSWDTTLLATLISS